MSEFKVGADAEAAFSDPGSTLIKTSLQSLTQGSCCAHSTCSHVSGQQQSTIPCVSEEELAKFVSLTPLSKTLQEIKESLQTLAHTSKTEDGRYTFVHLDSES